jgi:uncharacterized protein YndB with AHSA1/START domain
VITVEHTVEIDRPIEEVFAYLTDVERLPEWQASVSEVHADGPVGAGSRFRDVREFMGRRAASTLEVSTYEPPRRFSLRVVEGPIQYEIDHTLEEVGDRTSVRFSGRGETTRVPRLLRGVVERAVERQLVQDADALKRVLETGYRTSTLT